LGGGEIFKTKQYETKTFSNMKHWKLSNRTQDYFWGIIFTLCVLTWVYMILIFAD